MPKLPQHRLPHQTHDSGIHTLNPHACKTLSRVGNNNPIVVMRNNKPAAGVISPDEYRRLTEAEEDFALYLEAEERMKKGDGTRLGMDDVFGKEYKPVDDGYVPEFE